MLVAIARSCCPTNSTIFASANVYSSHGHLHRALAPPARPPPTITQTHPKHKACQLAHTWSLHWLFLGVCFDWSWCNSCIQSSGGFPGPLYIDQWKIKQRSKQRALGWLLIQGWDENQFH